MVIGVRKSSVNYSPYSSHKAIYSLCPSFYPMLGSDSCILIKWPTKKKLAEFIILIL